MDLSANYLLLENNIVIVSFAGKLLLTIFGIKNYV